MLRADTPERRPIPPLDAASLDRLALRYVERFATTRARLARYLTGKLRTRGFDGGEPQVDALVERLAGLGYIDDRAFATARAGAMTRRGLGPRRVAGALRHAGVSPADAEAAAPRSEEGEFAAALAFARRRRIGPFAAAAPDRVLIEKQIAAMVRAGHDFAVARRIARMEPGEDPHEASP